MNESGLSRRLILRLFLVLALVLMFSGCASTPKINWASRIGIYTYDQAVMDFGPPERYAKLSDNTVVAEWLTYRGRSTTYVTGGYSYGFGYYPGPPPIYVDTYGPNYYLRLTFDLEGKLKAWKKFAR